MTTQCPHCLTLFEIDADRLRAAAGTLRCDHCGRHFDASPATPTPDEHWFAGVARELEAHARAARDADAPEADAERDAAAPPAAPVAPASPPATRRARPDPAPAPIYVPPRAGFTLRGPAGWGLGCCALALVLAAQLAWAERVQLVLDPQTRPWMHSLCTRWPCRLPPISDPAQLVLLSRDVRPGNAAPGSLAITATLRNDAWFTQAWPVLVVALTDLDNQPVAMRRFRPPEYLPDAAQRADGIGADTTVAVAIEVADPGQRAVAFQFSFE